MSDAGTITTTTTATPWFSTLSEEDRGYLANRGLDKKTAVEAAAETIKAHREAERKLGLPADQVVRFPKDAADPGWNDVYQRLGAPKDKTGYTLDDVKFKDGAPASNEYKEWVRGIADELHLPVAAAQTIAQRFISYAEDDQAASAAELASARATAEVDLRRSWGGEYEKNMFLATKGAEQLGLTKDMIDAVATQIGVVKAMSEFVTLGSRMAEPAFHGGAGGGANTPALTREQAIDKKATLIADRQFMARAAQDTDVLKQLLDLDKIIMGPAPGR